MKPKEIVEVEIVKKLKASPEKASAVNAVIELQITGADGGTWTIDCTKPGGEISGGSKGAAKLTVTMSDADFTDMFLGKLKPQAAFLTGKVKVKGDIALALKLGNII
ncbi:MAG: SCP2 sterol-binding domain-containing protein [Deltaproteobacteria bacterium]|nr:SCP2 sterol-binding domain-containing protein [Deltaproteobacteria bacterium]MBI2974437.1 SCP2 sterol-binding domain-containing protein [Deltaproteobacteria bacterium]